jgi:ATPase involved in DNA repair
MLKKLTVQNYALIEALEIDFPDGLIILSGETGAGKSILLGALSLLLGKKVDASVVKDSGRNCVVEGEFECDNDELILRRVVSPNGRSRCFVNDEPVAIGELENVASKIIDIHAQHQHLLLSDEAFQMEILDYFSDSKGVLKEYKENFLLLNSAENELNKLNETIAKLEADKEYKQFQFSKLAEANLKEGELEELEREQKILANAENIKSSIIESINLLQPNGISIVQNIKDIIHNLQKCSNFVPEFNELVERLDSCRIEFKDIEAELEAKIESIDVSPDRLQIIDDRISLIYNLFRKFSVSNETELISLRDKFKNELDGGEKNDQQKQTLEKDIEKYKNRREDLAKKLSKKGYWALRG